jgi:hypothetical protein
MPDLLACPLCGSREDLVISGISLLPYRSTNPEDADFRWSVQCWGKDCGRPKYHINDATRDELFGTGWRDQTKEATDA